MAKKQATGFQFKDLDFVTTDTGWFTNAGKLSQPGQKAWNYDKTAYIELRRLAGTGSGKARASRKYAFNVEPKLPGTKGFVRNGTKEKLYTISELRGEYLYEA